MGTDGKLTIAMDKETNDIDSMDACATENFGCIFQLIDFISKTMQPLKGVHSAGNK